MPVPSPYQSNVYCIWQQKFWIQKGLDGDNFHGYNIPMLFGLQGIVRFSLKYVRVLIKEILGQM
jgi:hypothetical protein